ncbi:MAG: aminotransferase class I/II-fold pyridoxal phosphate-dependent enzyme [Flavobacteriaceae bacterium]|nr:aminotransferase class I/II-fold pyridoxal phosphate-dependent enzyme [Flavobacteriaceae bacterium]
MIKTANRLNSVIEYYFSTKLKEVAKLKQAGKPIINIGVGSPDLSPPTQVVEAILKASSQSNSHGYQGYQGLPELRKAMASFYKRKLNVELNYENEILPLTGSKEGVMHISMAFLNKGDEALVPNPGYPTYSSVTRLLEAKPVSYNLSEENNWLPDLVELEKTDLSKVKIMWINYPNMPSGASASLEDMRKIVEFAVKNDILLVNDNPYSFVLNEKPKSILEIEGSKNNVIELNSLSKSFNMAGWRVGMLIGSSHNVNAVLKVKSNMDSGMYYGLQKGAIAALNIGDEWFININREYRERREIVWRILDELKAKYDKNQVGLFVWAKIKRGVNSQVFTDNILYNYDVFITPGTVFGTNGEGYIRVSLCSSTEVLEEVFDRLKNIEI